MLGTHEKMSLTKFNVESACGEIAKGSLIEIPRGVYSHFVMYIGDGKCIHLTIDEDKPDSLIGRLLKLFKKGSVQIDDLKDILKDCIGTINNELDGKMSPRDVDEMLSIAKDMVGQSGYSPLFRNCETMCNYWRYGVPTSLQVVMVLEIIIAICAGIVVGGVFAELLAAVLGSFWSMVIGVLMGSSTTLGLLCYIYNTEASEIISKIVAKISGLALCGWISTVLLTILGVGVAGCCVYGAFLLVASETFKSAVNWALDTVCGWAQWFTS